MVVLSGLLVPGDVSVEVSIDCVLVDVVPLSLGKRGLACVARDVLSGVGDHCLDGDDSCCDGCSVLDSVALVGVVSVAASLAAPVVDLAVAIVVGVAVVSVGLTVQLLVLVEGREAVRVIIGHGLIWSEILSQDYRNLV